MSKRKFWNVVILTLIAVLTLACAVFFTACAPKEEPDDQTGGQTQTPGEDDPSGNENPGPDEPQDIAVTSISLNKTTLTMEIGESETLIATVLPADAKDKTVVWTSSAQNVATVDNGTVRAVASGTALITATTVNGKTASCNITVNAATPKITKVEGAEIDGTNIFMLVDSDVTNVPLLGKVSVSAGTWRLYSDILGQNEIPTKIAAGSSGELNGGDNVFYIMLTEENGDLACVYTLTIHRRHMTTVRYYNKDRDLVQTQSVSTGYEFDPDFEYFTDGYTFQYWVEDGAQYQPRLLLDELELYAYVTPNEYKVVLDANGGEVSVTQQTVVYDSDYMLAVPEKTGYSFLGWFLDDTAYTDAEGQSYFVWKIADGETLQARWQINQYTVSVEGNAAAGSVSSGGTFDYNAPVTFSATLNLGYDFIGWYEGDRCLSEDLNYSFRVPAKNATYTAKYRVKPELEPFAFTSTQSECVITDTLDLSVTKASIPEYVTEIGEGALSGCSALEQISLPFVGGARKTANDTYQYPFGYIFGQERYDNCYEIRQTYYGSSTNSTTQTTYYIPSALRSVVVTGGEILRGAFYGCSGLTSVTIPDGVTSIGSSAFYGCSSLTSITIPDRVTSMGEDAFYNCSGLTSIIVESGNPVYHSVGNCLIETTSKTLIMGCQTSTIPSDGSVTSIGSSAFEGCSGLTSITIPDKVTSIGSFAFRGCSGLTSVTIGNGVTSIGDSTFRDCTKLTQINYNAVSVKDLSYSDMVFYNAGTDGNGISVVFGDSVQTIPAYLFYVENSYYSPKIKSVTIGNGVTSMGKDAFYNCSGLTSIIVESGNPVYHSVGNCLIETTSKTLILGCQTSIIPSDDSVTSIGSSAFNGCSGLTSITIPDSVTSIGSSAFRGCSGLTSVTIGNGVTSIGSYAFAGCSGLKEVHIINLAAWCAIKFSYDSNPLYYAHNLYLNDVLTTDLVIPDSVTSIGSYAFSGCSSLTSITIPDSVTNIGSSAFEGCSGLTSIIIPDSVTSIGYDAFSDCSGLTSVTIGNGVTSIGDSAFAHCTRLTQINYNAVSAKVPYSNSDVFYNAGRNGDGISVVFGDSVQTIPAYLFSVGNYSYCPNIKSVTIGNGVESIGRSAFEGCIGLTSVTIGNSVTSIGSDAFYGCSGLKEVHISDIAAWCAIKFYSYDSNPLYYAHNLYLNDALITDLVIPDDVTSIGSYAFYNCSGLTSLTIPDSVTSIGERAFYGCTKLTQINYNAASVKNLSSSSDVFDNAGTDGGGISVIFGDSVQTIPAYLFYYCNSLTSVTIGNGVTSIGERAFYGCTKLTRINYNAVSVNDLSYDVFVNAGTDGDGISVIFGDSVQTIPAYLFDYCISLTSVTIGNGVTSIGSSAFEDCTKLTQINYNAVSVNNLSSSSYVFYDAGSDGDGISVVFGDSVQTIPAYLFSVGNYSYCPNIKSVTIGNGVESIGRSAFYNCRWLRSITIPDGVTSIGDWAFSGCIWLTSIAIPDSVTSIGSSVFHGCSHLTNVTIGNGVASIGSSAFEDCTKLTSVVFENPNGWWYSLESTATSGTSISSSSLASPYTAATYLTSTYYRYYWKRG